METQQGGHFGQFLFRVDLYIKLIFIDNLPACGSCLPWSCLLFMELIHTEKASSQPVVMLVTYKCYVVCYSTILKWKIRPRNTAKYLTFLNLSLCYKSLYKIPQIHKKTTLKNGDNTAGKRSKEMCLLGTSCAIYAR